MTRVQFGRCGSPVAAMVVAVIIACSNPTDVCGCTPLPPGVMVVGTLTDASGAGIARAQVLLDGIPPAVPFDSPLDDDGPTLTDASGEFRERVLNWNGQLGELVLRAGVIEAGTTDTLRFRLGMARFRTGSPLDTIRVAIAIP